MAQITPLTGTPDSDRFVVSGAPFDGVDVSAPDRQIIGDEEFISNFDVDADQFLLNAADFGVSTLTVAAVDGAAPNATVPDGANAIVLLNNDNDANSDTPFLAGTAATQIAGLTNQDGAGFFVYFNSILQLNRLVFSANLNDPTADLEILGRLIDAEGPAADELRASLSTANFGLEITGDDGDNLLQGSAGPDVINGLGGNDVIDGGGSADTLSTGSGYDTIAFSGDPFDGVDVSAPGRQIVGNEDRVTDFNFSRDQYRFEADAFGVERLQFRAIDSTTNRTLPDQTNVVVLLNADNDNNADTPFLAGTAAGEIAALTDSDRPGFFVYHNSILQLNRLVFSTNLNDASADLKIVSRQTDLTGQDAIDALADFSAANFGLERAGDDGNNVLRGTVADDVLDGGAGNDTLIGRRGNDTLLGGDDDDRLLGKGGDDILDGGLGDDRYIGGKGADVFVLKPGEGVDAIRDFRLFQGDRIALGSGLTFDDLTIRRFGGNGARLSVDGEDLAIVQANRFGAINTERAFVTL